MRLSHATLLATVGLASAAPKPAHQARLWATHYNGNVYTLALDGENLSLTDTMKTCGKMPSWLTFDSKARVLYCSDEDGTADPSTHGTLTAYDAAPDGKLHEIATTKTIGGGVNSVIYENDDGGKYLAIAHYEGSAVSTFDLPLKANAPAKQAFHFHMDHPGAVAQQDSPHPHEVFLDPTGSFLISGADLLRIYSISASDGQLNECPAVNVTFGSGPRHGVFWTDGTGNTTQSTQSGAITHQRQAASVGKTMMYLVNEIGGTMMTFDVAYDRSGCLDLQKTQTIVPYTGGKMPQGATPAEIRMVGDTFYVSIRSDQGFKPSDSMVTLDRSPKNGTVSLRNKTDAYGKVPRTFAINKAGDLVAIGNQASANVVIVRRNRLTGDLGEKVAMLQVGETGTVGSAEGLSSVVWEE
ncbi:hypothetical protein N7526_003224 [Penicillium atrosanguineum]|nr:hypothetical protein N7526_003224 [Penicillium atrosanguineum]